VFVWNLARPSVARDMPVRRFVIEPGARDRIAGLQFALSPDGRALVYPAVGERGASLQLRLLDQLAAQPIPGIEGAHDPTFSPDSQWIAFFVGPTLKKVSRTSGAPPITLAEFPGLVDKSIAWLPDDTIVVGRVAAGLFRVSAEGGTPIQLSTPDVAHGVIDHHTPRWLPGGNALLITRHRGPETWDVAALDTRTGAIREIVSDAFDARYLPTGHLVFARGQALLAAPFDVTTLALTGPPVVMVDRISANLNNGAARYDVSGDGLLAYIPAIPRGGRRLAWVGPNAAIEPLPVGPRAFSQPSLSPDGGRVAVGIEDGARRDIWIYELASGVLSRLTSDGASESPIWTRDGRRVTFSKIKDGRRELYWQRVDGTSPAERLVTDPYSVFPGSWSAHGRRLVFTRQPPTDQTDIGLFDADVGSTTMTIASDKQEEQPRFSTDGRWLASTTYETPERSDVFIASLDGSTQRQISVDGGFAPVWRPDGRVLYYRFVPRSIMAVDVSRFPTTIGRPTPIVKDAQFVLGSAFGHPGYDGAADGRLLVVQAGAEEAAPPRFEIVLNWFEELKQRVPVRGRD
jgi:eukaryotic-like serine/threonine-protein kinase